MGHDHEHNRVFHGLTPTELWHHFGHITEIARPSGKEERMAEYVIQHAKSLGLATERDAVGNLVVRVPASPGREKAPTIVLKGHLDMVCEKDPASPYDPEQGRIHVVRDGDWLTAEGTTLGADNGIAIATMLALAGARSIKHGPLELLMTIDEETGMTGASGLDPKLLAGRMMINLDSEDEGILFVGCAGGRDVKHTFKAARSAAPSGWVALQVTVGGLKGGHSGLEINSNRLNAIRALARALNAGGQGAAYRIAAIDGGNKRNAIPRDAKAVVFVEAAREAAFRAGVEAARKELADHYKGLDDGLKIAVGAPESASAATGGAFAEADSRRLVDLLRATPTGVVAMSMDIKGLVESSTNLGVITTDGETVEIANLARSSNGPALQDIVDQLLAVARLAGVEATDLGGYPGWKPDMSSRSLAATKRTFEKLYGRVPEVTAIHAGLECGLIGDRVPGMDMVSFGPDIRGVHAPGEKVHAASAGRFYDLLGAVLDELSA
jgi:dipeptidase D